VVTHNETISVGVGDCICLDTNRNLVIIVVRNEQVGVEVEIDAC
jgi:hypothetical protein